MSLLSGKGAAWCQCDRANMVLPHRSQGSTLKNDMLFITNSTTVFMLLQAKQPQ